MNERRADFELLRDFVRQHDQPAFATVVRRHLDLVYVTALRKVESQEAAEESQKWFAGTVSPATMQLQKRCFPPVALQ